MRKVTVTIYGVDHKMVERWIFDNAYPVKWSGPQLKSSEAALAIEELEIAHHGFTVET
jgi:phage tail-like protein